MPENNEYYDLLYAYSLGCLDKDDIEKLKKYLKPGAEYNWQELGEYQNLVSLLPSILNMEFPAPKLKDNIARKLYRMKDEIRAKRSKEMYDQKHINSIPQEDVTEELKNAEDSEQDEIEIDMKKEFEDESISKDEPISEPFDGKLETKKLVTKTEEFEVVTPKSKAAENFRPPQTTQIKEREAVGDVSHITPAPPIETNVSEEKHENEKAEQAYIADTSKKYEIKKKPRKKKFVPISISILFVAAVAAWLYFTYIKISTEVKDYKLQTVMLKEEIKTLSFQISHNKEILNLLKEENVHIVNLKGTKLNKSGYGKAIVSMQTSSGYLQLSQMPVLPEGIIYQLWVSVAKRYVSLGVFSPAYKGEYFPFTLPELNGKYETRFILTEEPVSGSENPGKKIVLEGTLQ